MASRLVINLTKDQAQVLARDLGAPRQPPPKSVHPLDLLAAMFGVLTRGLLTWLTHLVRRLPERYLTDERAKEWAQEFIWLRLYHDWRKSVKH